MCGSYLIKNLENLKDSDWVKVIEVHKNSKKHLTLNQEYRVIQIKENPERPGTNKFCIKTNTGEKKWYKHKNMMFKKRDGYNQAQLDAMKSFTKEIENLVQVWNQLEDRPDRDELYERDRDLKIDEYLKMVINSTGK